MTDADKVMLRNAELERQLADARRELADCQAEKIVRLGVLGLSRQVDDLAKAGINRGGRIGKLETDHANLEKCVQAIAEKLDSLGRFVARLNHNIQGQADEASKAAGATNAAGPGDRRAQTHEAPARV